MDAALDPLLSRVPPGARSTPAFLAGRGHHAMNPDSAASFATFVDSARVRAAVEGRTLIYSVRWVE